MMICRNSSCYNNILIHLLSTVLLFSGCKTAVEKGSVASDPFPKKLIGHKTFNVFRSGDPETWLGRVFRDEKKQLLDAKYWVGEILGSDGERREIEYTREQSFTLQSRMPKFNLKLGPQLKGDITFSLVLDGLKIYQLTRPVLNEEFRDDQGSKTTGFIISVLQAKEIIMKVLDNTGVEIGFEGTFKKIVVEANYKYSKKHKGIIVARDTIIGYMLAEPKASDLRRR